MSSLMAWFFLKAESWWTWCSLTSVPWASVPHTSFVSASWVLGLQAFMWASLSWQSQPFHTISPRPSTGFAREQGKRLDAVVNSLLWEKPGYRRCSLAEVATVLIWLTIAPSGNETFGKGHSLDPLIGWMLAYCVQLMKTESLCLHRYTFPMSCGTQGMLVSQSNHLSLSCPVMSAKGEKSDHWANEIKTQSFICGNL